MSPAMEGHGRERFKGKVAFVTGAAGGIGSEVARRLLAEGATVHAADLAPVPAQANPAWVPVKLDVTSEDSWAAAMAGLPGMLDVLVNCAGIIRGMTIASADLATWNMVLAVNATGTMLGCRHGLLAMGQGGAIVNISSGMARRPQAIQLAYGASKAAVEYITKATALHCGQAGNGVRVNCVQPGAIDSVMLSNARPAALPEADYTRNILARHPIGRLGTYEDIARAVLFLASDESSFTTGTVFSVDGGMSI